MKNMELASSDGEQSIDDGDIRNDKPSGTAGGKAVEEK